MEVKRGERELVIFKDIPINKSIAITLDLNSGVSFESCIFPVVFYLPFVFNPPC